MNKLFEEYRALHPHLDIKVTHFSNALELLNSETVFDYYFLDILLGDISGIDLARKLRVKGITKKISFSTYSSDYALPAFSVRASGYLVKPIKYDALAQLLDEAVAEIATKTDPSCQRFCIRSPGTQYIVEISDILFVEITGHTPIFHLTQRIIRGSDLRITFEECVAPLIQTGIFLRPHRSFLVNANHISAIAAYELSLSSGEVIPIARRRSTIIKSQYLDYLMGANK